MFDLHGEAQAMVAGQGDRLIRRRLKEATWSGRGRPMTERDQQHTTRAEETGDPWHCLATLQRVEMDPDGGQHHDIESATTAREACEAGEVVVDPFNVRSRV